MVDIEDNIKRSDEIQDIMGKMPHWLIRRGSIIVAYIFAIIILLLYFIKYPDMIDGKITITSSTPPSSLSAKTTGKIQLFKQDKDLLKKGEIIAYIENAADYQDIITLREHLFLYDSIAKNPITTLLDTNINLTQSYQLGELQLSHNNFINECLKFQLFISLNENHVQIKSLQEKLQLSFNKSSLLNNKQKTALRKLEVAQRQFSKDSTLFKKGIISEVDLDQSEKSYIDILTAYEEVRGEILTNQNEIISLKIQIENLLITDTDKSKNYEISIQSSFKTLESTFRQWEEKYFIIAPVNGRLSLYNFWSNTQIVKEGEEIAAIISNSPKIIGKLYVEGKRFGKVEENQKVKIMLDNYPASEFGMIYGKVESFSNTNKDNIYLVNIILPEGLTTSDHKEIKFNNEMHGTGQIITENMSVIERVFYKTRAAFNE